MVPSIDTALRSLHSRQGELSYAVRQVERAVAYARSCGATWQQIGDALGVSRQAAWERYGARSPWRAGL